MFCNIPDLILFKIYFMSQGETNNSQGEQDTAELGANTDANHTCSNFLKIFFWYIFIFLMLMKENVFCLFLLLKLIKEDDITSSICLLMLDLYVEPNQIFLDILTDQLQ